RGRSESGRHVAASVNLGVARTVLLSDGKQPLGIVRRDPAVFYRSRLRVDLQQPSANSDGDCVGSIVRAELLDEVLDMEVDRGFCNSQAIGNLLVSMAVANQAEYLQFPRRE